MVYNKGFTSVPNSESGGILNSDTPFSPKQWCQVIIDGLVEHTLPELFDKEPQEPLKISPVHK